MAQQGLPQRNRGSLVEKYAHLCSQQSRPGRVFEDVTSLGQGNAGKPLKEVMNGGVFFQVLKERGDRHPCATENPSTTHTILIAFNIGTGRPINHG